MPTADRAGLLLVATKTSKNLRVCYFLEINLLIRLGHNSGDRLSPTCPAIKPKCAFSLWMPLAGETRNVLLTFISKPIEITDARTRSIYLMHRDAAIGLSPISACELPWVKKLMIRSRLLAIGEEHLSERSDG